MVKNNNVVIINGLGGCGKSTFIGLCKVFSEGKNIRVYELSSVDFVKEVAVFCGWDGSKTQKNRTFLHDLKVILEDWDNIPNKKVLEEINFLATFSQENGQKNEKNVFFVNIREDYNIDAFKDLIKDKYKCYTLLINNPNNKTNEVPELINKINNYNYDFVINNDGDLNYLYSLADRFMTNLNFDFQ